MTSPNIIGPITNSDSFFLTTIYQGDPYVLALKVFNTNVNAYYWESNLQSSNISAFSSNNNVIKDSSGGIGFDTTNTYLINTPSPTSIDIGQNQYAPWWPPTQFLSNVPYEIKNSNGQPAQVYLGLGATGAIGPTGPTIPATGVYVVSTNWYFAASAPNTCNYLSPAPQTILNWFCNVKSTLPVCTTQIIPSGFTTIDLCVDGKQFNYCPINTTCGTTGCNGPCAQEWYDCDYRSNQFVCVFDPQKYAIEAQWWKNPYVIGAVIVSIIIIIILIIIMVAVAKKVAN